MSDPNLTPKQILESMKKNLMLLALSGLSVAAVAQNTTEVTEVLEVVEVRQDKYAVVTNPFWDNWFISLGGGATVLFGDYDAAGSFGKRISPTLNVAVGKWFIPGLGGRLQYSGLQARGYVPSAGSDYAVGAMQDGGYYKQRFNYMNLHADVMFNLNALFGGYNPSRVYEIIPYVGAGFTHNYSTPHRDALSVNGGIINRFRVSNAIDINLELSGVLTEDKFDGGIGGKGYDGLVSATVGLTYRFPRRGFDRPRPAVSEERLAVIRDKMNRMAIENAQLAEALLAAQNQEPTIEETEIIISRPVITPRTVFFTIGSSEVSAREAMNLSYLAESIKQYPQASYVVNGYADAATGTPEYNQKLARQRAEAVINVLVEKYGVDRDKLSVGTAEAVDSFGEPILNRVVVVESAQ